MLIFLIAFNQASAQEPPSLQTPRDKVNYSLGVNIVSNLRQQGVEIDLDLVTRGMKDALTGAKLLLSDEEIRIAIQRYQTELRQNRSQAAARASVDNRKEGEEFLARNKGAEGVVTLPSGLQYKVLVAGDGPTPTDESTVEVTYRGMLVDGTEFESFFGTGKTATMKVSAAIPGWREALKLMPTGSKWQLFVPSALAYGDRGKPGVVGPHAALIFELELHAIK